MQDTPLRTSVIGSYPFPAFNLADAAISVGAVLLILSSFFSNRDEETEEETR